MGNIGLIQLRHVRASNQIAALNETRERVESPEFQEFVRKARELPRYMADPAARRRLLAPEMDFPGEFQWLLVLMYFYEHLGILVKNGVIDRTIACETWAIPLLTYWPNLAPIVANRREALHTPALWENFEYLMALCKQWIATHPHGAYPPNAPRVSLPELWPEVTDVT
ncbi:MAG TPA: hypothetical protein VMS32_04880 [Verrucomicrobiae bacterium]|jgi:hypothetical protein|nr:hypothetical protein [Verrucomicrobiae bacterium]